MAWAGGPRARLEAACAGFEAPAMWSPQTRSCVPSRVRGSNSFLASIFTPPDERPEKVKPMRGVGAVAELMRKIAAVLAAIVHIDVCGLNHQRTCTGFAHYLQAAMQRPVIDGPQIPTYGLNPPRVRRGMLRMEQRQVVPVVDVHRGLGLANPRTYSLRLRQRGDANGPCARGLHTSRPALAL